jgi:uncharacterized protein (DUF1697 family)
MNKYVAFLRGINVGGRIIKMADLKTCLEGLGFQNVVTLLQSGNVIMESHLDNVGDVRKKLEEGVGEEFSYNAKILVYRGEDLESLVEAYPFDSSEESFQHYVILMDQKAGELAAEETDPGVEDVQLGKGVVYWRVVKGKTLDSLFGKKLGQKEYKDHLTNRNIKTLRKITSKIA